MISYANRSLHANEKNPVGRIGRWAQNLMSYAFKVKHRKGKCNVVLDALSRLYEDENSQVKISTVEIVKGTSDKVYKKHIYQVRKFSNRYRDWNIINGNLYKYKSAEKLNEVIGDLDAWKFVVPREKRAQVLNKIHNEPTAGYNMGIDKTYHKVAQSYY